VIQRRHRWKLLKLQHITDLFRHDASYLDRLRIIQTPWGGIFLHRINLNDGDRHLHNHPWKGGFVSIILKGGYTEEWAHDILDATKGPISLRTWKRWSIHRLRNEEYHSIRKLLRTPTWTLLIVGSDIKSWGYATEIGWVDANTYHALRRDFVGVVS